VKKECEVDWDSSIGWSTKAEEVFAAAESLEAVEEHAGSCGSRRAGLGLDSGNEPGFPERTVFSAQVWTAVAELGQDNHSSRSGQSSYSGPGEAAAPGRVPDESEAASYPHKGSSSVPYVWLGSRLEAGHSEVARACRLEDHHIAG
jgi:hypothetical protein